LLPNRMSRAMWHEATEIAREVINAVDDAHANRGPGVGAGGGAMEEHNGEGRRSSEI